MKKIFTLTVGVLMTVVMFAADRRPSVTINSSRNYEIVIDGRSYYGGSKEIRLQDAYGGRHMIKVFEQSRGYFGRGKRLVDASSFKLTNHDVIINIDRFGQISIREVKGWNKSDRNNRGFEQDSRDQKDNRNFDPNGNGQKDRQQF